MFGNNKHQIWLLFIIKCNHISIPIRLILRTVGHVSILYRG